MKNNAFLQQVNLLAKESEPFFFLIDFEQRKPVVYPLSECAKHGIFYQTPQQNNINEQYFSDKFQSVDVQKIIPRSLIRNAVSLDEYRRGFEIVQQAIHFGNSYLLNLTYPTEIRTDYTLSDIFYYSQAPFKLLLQDKFVCFSPEAFIQIRNNHIFTYPMKGTIKADLPHAKERLLDSQKERWEHNTIVDLMRNDLAMVAKNIEVTRFRYCEQINTTQGTLLQTSSEIRGELNQNWRASLGDLLYTLLPAGSVSGAPKKKTVEVIQQAEQQPRGYYTGVFGIFDGQSVNSAVIIRYIEQQKDKLFFRSGGGITASSNLEDEYQELLHKVYLPFMVLPKEQ